MCTFVPRASQGPGPPRPKPLPPLTFSLQAQDGKTDVGSSGMHREGAGHQLLTGPGQRGSDLTPSSRSRFRVACPTGPPVSDL